MTLKLTARQLAFANAFIETGNAAESYRRSYTAENMSEVAVRVEANRLLNHPNVSLTIKAHREKNQQRHDITVDKLTSMAIDAYNLAMKDEVQAPAAAVSALLAIGKLHGLVVDKKEVTRKRDASDLSLEELYAIAGMGRAGNPAQTPGDAELDRVH